MTRRVRRRRRRIAITSPGVIVIDPRRETSPGRPSRWTKAASPAGLAVASIGALHLVQPRWFARPIGMAFPEHRRAWTTATGIAEIVLGSALYNPRTRTAGVVGSAVVLGAWAGRVSRRPRAARRRDASASATTRQGVLAPAVVEQDELHTPPAVAPSES